MSEPKFFLLVPGNEFDTGGSTRSNLGRPIVIGLPLVDDLDAVDAWRRRLSGEPDKEEEVAGTSRL